MKAVLSGPRHVLDKGSADFPAQLAAIPSPPEHLYVIGDVAALSEGLSVVGARKATQYGRGCAQRFSRIAAEKGIVIISGGARGCDSEAHRAAMDAGGRTVAFLGGGCDNLYPAENAPLFQRIIDTGGAVVSEMPWDCPPKPYMFRLRNRLIAGCARAVLIVEAGLPSGTFSTADEALEAGREVLVVPGAITSYASRGANRLLYQGAVPVVDDETFEDTLGRLFGCLRTPVAQGKGDEGTIPVFAENQRIDGEREPLVAAVLAEPLGIEDLARLAKRLHPNDARTWMMEQLIEAESAGIIARQADGKWGPRVPGQPR